MTVNTAVPGFDSDRSQSERAALGIAGNIVYVPYGGRFGDCGSYRGRLVGVQMNNPASVMSWATTSTRAGVWGPGGVASDGTNPFVTTGNGSGGVTWSGSEAVIRLQPGPVFSGSTTDYWAPTNWRRSTAAIPIWAVPAQSSSMCPAPRRPPWWSHWARMAMPICSIAAILAGSARRWRHATCCSGTIIQAAATYRTAHGHICGFSPGSSTLTAFRITATNPPTIANGWSVTGQSGRGSPFVTSTDGTNNVIVWVVGSEGDSDCTVTMATPARWFTPAAAQTN